MDSTAVKFDTIKKIIFHGFNRGRIVSKMVSNLTAVEFDPNGVILGCTHKIPLILKKESYSLSFTKLKLPLHNSQFSDNSSKSKSNDPQTSA